MGKAPPPWLWVACPPMAFTLTATTALTSSRDSDRSTSRRAPALPVSERLQEEYAVDLEEMR